MKRSGLTITSMVLYVALFFAFSAFAIAISTNFNYRTLSEKGQMWVNEQYDKLQYNLLNSAKESSDVSNISGKIVFSNNDEYEYDGKKKRVLKNGGIIAMDVEKFNVILDKSDLDSSIKYPQNIDESVSNIAIDINLKKYGNEKVSQLFITTGVDSNETI